MTWAERSTEAVRTAPELTPLQVWLKAVYDVLGDAREMLPDDDYAAFVWVVCDRIGIEAARLAVGEALRATRGESEAA